MTAPLRLRLAILAATALLTSACDREAPADAYGNFEADEVVVASEVSGPLQQFDVHEGKTLAAGALVGRVDTTPLAIERAQIRAQRSALLAQSREVERQVAALAIQHEIAQRTYARTSRLFDSSAATASQRDLAEREARVLGVQRSAAALSIERVEAEVDALDARIEAVSDRLQRAHVTNPLAGTVLVTFVNEGELVQAGQPLYQVASLDTLTLRAYVTGGQLGNVKLGETVDVRVSDAEGGLAIHSGVISWVSPSAEFTPTPVQTRDERADLVYAVKVRVPNPDGALKIGMPADVTLRNTVASAP